MWGTLLDGLYSEQTGSPSMRYDTNSSLVLLVISIFSKRNFIDFAPLRIYVSIYLGNIFMKFLIFSGHINCCIFVYIIINMHNIISSAPHCRNSFSVIKMFYFIKGTEPTNTNSGYDFEEVFKEENG